ncbi:MAG: hypothetical protein HYR85_01360 [Planctomycetes bacterium]|nr:hypothetical protein [Planctomycetota bacterium]MBI3843123.1 hypothetical protein [Planctomycetota bacterium]
MTRSERLVLVAVGVIGAIVVALLATVFFQRDAAPQPVKSSTPASESPPPATPKTEVPPKDEPPPESIPKVSVKTPPAEAAVDLGEGTGSLAGVVRFRGTPTLVRIHVDKDAETCGTERLSPRLRVSESGGVADSVIYLDHVDKGEGIDQLPQGILDQLDCEFTPHVQIHPWNQDLIVKNSDPLLHTVRLTYRGTDDVILNMPFPAPGETSRRVPKPGIIAAQCDAGHRWASGYVFAVEHPYYAISDDEGRWSLEDVPAGRYVLRFWHEGFKLLGTRTGAGGNVTGDVWSPDVTQEQPVALATGKKIVVDFELSDDK